MDTSGLNLRLWFQCPEAQQENNILDNLAWGYLSPGLCLSWVSCSFSPWDYSSLPGSLWRDRTFRDLVNSRRVTVLCHGRMSTFLQPSFANSRHGTLLFANPAWQENRHLFKSKKQTQQDPVSTSHATTCGEFEVGTWQFPHQSWRKEVGCIMASGGSCCCLCPVVSLGAWRSIFVTYPVI